VITALPNTLNSKLAIVRLVTGVTNPYIWHYVLNFFKI
jgi:hypothetical protein